MRYGVWTKILIAAAAFALIAPVNAHRLWFRNASTGEEGPGAVLAGPGDQIEVWLHLKASKTAAILMMVLDLDGLTLMSDAAANTWQSQLDAAIRPNSEWIYKQYHMPIDGPIYDWAADTWDAGKPLDSEKGEFFFGGNWHGFDLFTQRIFQFTVQPGSVSEYLDWKFPGRPITTGLITGIVDGHNDVSITDNWVVVGGGQTMTGHLDLEEAVHPEGLRLMVNFRDPDTQDVVAKRIARVDANGNYAVYGAPVGTFDVDLKPGHWLSRIFRNITLSGSGATLSDSFCNGDLDGNNVVDLPDANLVFTFYGTDHPDGDADASGAVDLSDLSIIAVNFGLAGGW